MKNLKLAVSLVIGAFIATPAQLLAATCSIPAMAPGEGITATSLNQRFAAFETCVNSVGGVASIFRGPGSVTDAVDLATAEVAGVIPTANMSTSVALIDNSRTYTANPVFEGSVVDAFKTTIAITNPTAARTITVKDASGTLAFTSDIATASLLRVPIVTTAGTTYTTGTGTTMLLVRLCGAGGGGGGGDFGAASTYSAGSGGGAGGYAEKAFTVTPSTGYTIAIGTAGTAGTAGPNAGGNGGNTTFTVGGVTVTAFGGQGGPSMAAALTDQIGSVPAATVISANGDLNSGGAPGDAGFARGSSFGNIGGIGGSSQFGAGGRTSGDAVGGNGIGFCSGGGGGATISAVRAGGAGTAGVIVTYEYVSSP